MRPMVARALVTLLASTPPPLPLLSTLAPGDALEDCTVVAKHNCKIFLRVPVLRTASGGEVKEMKAYASLPQAHELLSDKAIGRKLTAYVKRIQVESGRLSVDVRAPRPQRCW